MIGTKFEQLIIFNSNFNFSMLVSIEVALAVLCWGMGNFAKHNACSTWQTATGHLTKILFTSIVAVMKLNKTLQSLLTDFCSLQFSLMISQKFTMAPYKLPC